MEKYYQIQLDNTVGYSKTYNDAITLQNYLYKRTQKICKIRLLRKYQIPIKDWELINQLNQKVKVSIRIQ